MGLEGRYWLLSVSGLGSKFFELMHLSVLALDSICNTTVCEYLG